MAIIPINNQSDNKINLDLKLLGLSIQVEFYKLIIFHKIDLFFLKNYVN
ncbi:MAG: hypothetical protein V6012_01275 [Candidatus Dasytiphilus stammeri]